jgi:hypothetical protein
MSNGGAPAGRAAWMEAVSARICAGSTMLCARNRVTPATFSSRIRLAAYAGSFVPVNAIISRSTAIAVGDLT